VWAGGEALHAGYAHKQQVSSALLEGAAQLVRRTALRDLDVTSLLSPPEKRDCGPV
jgi:hypothetical protein